MLLVSHFFDISWFYSAQIAASFSLFKPSLTNWHFCWIIGKSLGSGTFGKVRIGTHTITGEKVAIKILEKDRIKDKGDVERVTREINILKKVRHPNVIQLYEVRIFSPFIFKLFLGSENSKKWNCFLRFKFLILQIFKKRK